MNTVSPAANAAPRGIFLSGPTGSGKTALALAFAARHPVEIISVDSALVYRHLDIGTAKPSVAEQARVPHHLIDILEPSERYSAAAFAADARRLMDDIAARGRLPLLVGGTLLYYTALRDGLARLPAADPQLRTQLDAEAAVLGWPALHAELARVDPATAARLAPRDAQRVQRALEVYRASGRPLSAWLADDSGREATGFDDNNLPVVSLEPVERGWLHERLRARFAGMLGAGLVDEVARLRGRGDLHPDLPSMRSVGYRQTWEALDQGDLAGLLERGTAATRQLAKRQLTWLRSLPARRVVACDAPDAIDQGLTVLQSIASTSTL